MKPDISVIIPLYNEVDNIEPLGCSIINALQGQNYEVVYIDDGSTDGSAQKLREWCAGGDRRETTRGSSAFLPKWPIIYETSFQGRISGIRGVPSRHIAGNVS